MELFPFHFQSIGSLELVSNGGGDFFFTTDNNIEKLVYRTIDKTFLDFLTKKGFTYRRKGDLYWNAHKLKIHKRRFIPKNISYFIIVPTLRCNLNCSYCQVSRVNESSKGYDWTDDVLSKFFQFAETQQPDSVKIEFQGGEPTLRTDLIQKVISWADHRFNECEFVICSNLQNLSTEFFEIIQHDNVFVSTSIDGTNSQHQKHRTITSEKTHEFRQNLEYIFEKFGTSKVSALPTITDFERIDDTIDEYIRLGFGQVFLRPVNYQGFARKSFPESKIQFAKWTQAYQAALDKIFSHNYSNPQRIREFGFETSLKRIFHLGHTGYVDLRSPNFAARDYLVVDYDGTLYPSDEARMVSRIGVVDLSIGNVESGIATRKLNQFNWEQIGEVNPDCIHCAYQPYCGTDLIDDLSRDNRIDKPKQETSFCQTQMSKFSDIFQRLISHDPVNMFNIAGHLTNDFSVDPVFSHLIYDQT